jgi:hypothetical protein
MLYSVAASVSVVPSPLRILTAVSVETGHERRYITPVPVPSCGWSV